MDRRSFLMSAAAAGFGAALLKRASAQSFPTRTSFASSCRDSASTPPDILARIVAQCAVRRRRLEGDRREQARRRDDHRRDRGAEAAGRRPYHLVGYGAGRGRARARSQRAVQATKSRLRAADPDRHRLQRAGGQSVGAGPLRQGTGRLSEEEPRQAHVLFGRLRHARASDRRDVQAARPAWRPSMCRTTSSRRRSAIWSAASTPTSSSPSFRWCS